MLIEDWSKCIHSLCSLLSPEGNNQCRLFSGVDIPVFALAVPPPHTHTHTHTHRHTHTHTPTTTHTQAHTHTHTQAHTHTHTHTRHDEFVKHLPQYQNQNRLKC